jgi:hypothetical protein
MKRFLTLPRLLFFVSVVSIALAAMACSDKVPGEHTAGPTAPGRARLTMSNLPSDASTVCVSAVSQRDQLLASDVTSDARQTKLEALDALVQDTCY